MISAALLVAAAFWHGCQRKLELGFDPDDGGPPDAATDAGTDAGAPGEDDAGPD